MKNRDNVDKNIVDLINDEISHIRFEKLEPGWTIWALIAAISSLIWLFINEVEKSQAHFYTVIVIYLIIEYIISGVISLFSLTNGMQNINSPTYYRPIGFISPSKQQQIVFILSVVLRIIITYFLQDKVGILVSALSYLYNILGIFFVFIRPSILKEAKRKKILFLQEKITNSRERQFVFVVYFINLGMLIFLSYSYIRFCFDVNLIVNITDIKIVAILISVIYLLSMWAKIQTKSPVLDMLVEIRRDYVLGGIDTSATKKRLENSLSGFKVTDVQSELQSLFGEYLNNAEKEINSAIEYMDYLEVLYKSLRNNNTQKNLDEIKITNERIYDHIHKFSTIMLDDVDFVFLNILKMIKRHKGGGAPNKDFYLFLNEYKDRVDKVNDKFWDTEDRWIEVLSNYESESVVTKWSLKVSEIDTLKIDVEKKKTFDG